LLSAATALISLASLNLTYSRSTDNITPTYTIEQVREGAGEQVADALRGRRATAATWALAYALLCGWVVLVPYRRGERWAWWALLISLGLSQLLSLARVLAFGTTFGSGAAGTLLAFLLLGLMAGAPRIFSDRDATPEL
jgi:hypothetical protein